MPTAFQPTHSAALLAAPPAATVNALDRLSHLIQADRAALSAVARREGLSPEAAIDCVQDALCTLLDLVQTGQVAVGGELGPVLVTIVRNEARNQRRRHFRSRPHVELAEDLAARDLVLPDSLLARAEDTVRLRACVAELCEIQRAVVTLRLLEERPGDDVAELLGVSKNHVAVLLYRSKAALRECMTSPP